MVLIHIPQRAASDQLSLVVAFGDVRMHVPVPAAEYRPEPGGGVPLGEHLVVRRVVLYKEHPADAVRTERRGNTVTTELHAPKGLFQVLRLPTEMFRYSVFSL